MTTPEDTLVEVEELVKRYPKAHENAVDGISFTVRRGEVFGLLGPNGAGKSTTIGILTTRVRPTSGQARLAGVDVTHNPVAVRRLLAVVPQHTNLDRSLSARRNLLYHAAYFGIPKPQRERRADELLDTFGLADRAGDTVDHFSGGQSQRLMIARALMHTPAVLFLDEPSTGLDPQARLFVWDQVRAMRDRGVTVVLTTHDMDEAAELADRVGIVDHGKLLALDTPAALTGLVPGDSMLEITVTPGGARAPDVAGLEAALAALPGMERVEQVQARMPALVGAGTGAAPPGGDGQGDRAARLRLYCSCEAASMIPPVVALLGERDERLDDLSLGRPSLEDVFIHLTGRDLRG